MNPVAAWLARRIPLLGILLLVGFGSGIYLHLGRTDYPADWALVLLTFPLSIFCMMRRKAIDEPLQCRILAIYAIALYLLGLIIRSFFTLAGQPMMLGFSIGSLASFAFFIGIVGMLGSTLALRDDPDHDSAHRYRRFAAKVTFVGFGILLLSEILRVVAIRSQAMSSIAAGASIFTLFVVLVRGCLAAAAVLVVLRPAGDGAAFRREAWIFKSLVASVGFSILSWLAFVVTGVFQLLPGLQDYGRYLWLSGLLLTLTVLCIALIPVAVRKPDPGYNSTSGLNSSGGAEA